MARARAAWQAVTWLIGGTALLWWSGATPAGGEGVQEVRVLNFPDSQRIEGRVSLQEPVTLAAQFVTNARRWLAGQPLLNVVDKKLGYVSAGAGT